MATDNTLLSAPVGTGVTVRTFADGGGIEWPASVTAYVTGGSAGAWTLAQVDLTHGLPVQPMTGATFAVSAASLPLPTGASTAAKQPALGTAGSASADVITVQGVASMTPLLVTATISAAQTIAVTNAGTFAVQATQSGTWTVGISAAQTIGLSAGSAVIGHVIVDSGTLAATQSGTWTVGVSAAQTIAVTNAGTFAVQAAQTGTWNVTVNTALPAGTNVIGHVIVDSGVITTVSTVTAVTTVSTVTAVTAITNALPAGTNLMGKAGIDQTTPGTTNGVSLVGAASGGASTFHVIAANSTNATNVKASAGTLKAVQVYNISAAVAWLKLYNSASAPTAGSGTPAKVICIPGNTAAGSAVPLPPEGVAFSSGIGFTLTTGIADNDTGVVPASSIAAEIDYK